MKKFLLGSAALALVAATPAFAADLPARTYTKAAPAYMAPIYNWTGFLSAVTWQRGGAKINRTRPGNAGFSDRHGFYRA